MQNPLLRWLADLQTEPGMQTDALRINAFTAYE